MMSARSTRPAARGLAVAVMLMSIGCGPGDCLPPPQTDASAPVVELTIGFTDAATGERTEARIDASVSGLRLEADPSGVIDVQYRVADPEGMRRVLLGATVQQTVAVGNRRRALQVEPVEASCPRPALAGTFTYRPRADESVSLGLGIIAENWSGERVSTPTHVVRLEASSDR